MKTIVMFWVVQSEKRGNIWFIFRENGREVEVMIRNNMMLPKLEMTPEERAYFRKYILEKGEKIVT